MRFYVKRETLHNQYKNLDRIDDPSIYDLKPTDSEYVELEHYLNHLKETKQLASASESSVEWSPPMMRDQERAIIKANVQKSYRKINQLVVDNNSEISPRTQAHNRKCSEKTLEDERTLRVKLHIGR